MSRSLPGREQLKDTARSEEQLPIGGQTWEEMGTHHDMYVSALSSAKWRIAKTTCKVFEILTRRVPPFAHGTATGLVFTIFLLLFC